MESENKVTTKKYPGTIWGLTSFFNHKGHKYKTDYYRIFKNNIQRQGLKLLTVECALKGEPFVLTPEDADILIQVRSDSILWHKERLLNIGFKRLPADCDKIVLTDCDLIFLDDDWVQKSCDLLENYECIKPFFQAIRLTKKTSNKIMRERKYYPSDNYYYQEDEVNYCNFDPNFPFKHPPVFAWAMRKEIFDGLGFYDRMIIGSGDTIMTAAFHKSSSPLKNSSPALDADIITWFNKIDKRMAGRMTSQDGAILHLFHGTRKNRKYYDRNAVLEKYDFQPYEDIKLNADQCWEWATPKKNLHQELELYFIARNENQEFIAGLIAKYKVAKARLKIDIIPRLIGLAGKMINYFSPDLYRRLKKYF